MNAGTIGCLTVAAAATASAAPPPYIVKDLGTLAGPATKFEPGSAAAAISPSGLVVGHSVTDLPSRNFHAFRSLLGPGAPPPPTDLGVLGEDAHSMAFAVNAAGDAVGVSYELGELTVHGVRWPASGPPVALGAFEARDISDAGVIAGSIPVAGASGTTHAARIDAGVTTDLGTLGGPSSMGLAVNASGWVVGQSILADGLTTRGFVWRNGSMLSLPTLGGGFSTALDIRDLTIVGLAAGANQRPHATRWTLDAGGGLVSTVDLGTLPGALSSSALAVNASGTVVGVSGRAAFIHDGTMKDLNGAIDASSGWSLERATGISDDGRIVGVGKHLGLARAFALVPRAPADLNADGIVNAADLALLLGEWGNVGSPYELSGDGTVDGEDLAILIGSWSA